MLRGYRGVIFAAWQRSTSIGPLGKVGEFKLKLWVKTPRIGHVPSHQKRAL